MPKKNPPIGKSAESRSVFVDSSAWIALFSRRDQHHADADRLFRKAISSGRPLLTSNLILAEIHRLLLFRAGSKAAIAALQRIETSPLVTIAFADSEHHQSAKSWLDKLDEHPISYTDAISFSIMEAKGCREVLSYDRHFRVAGF